MRGSGRARSRLKQGLVVAEVGLSALLLVATGLLLRSFWALGATSPGFDAYGVLAARIAPGGDAYREREKVEHFYEDAMRASARAARRHRGGRHLLDAARRHGSRDQLQDPGP